MREACASAARTGLPCPRWQAPTPARGHGSSCSEPLLDTVHKCTYLSEVRFEWDEEKAQTNLRKHGVEFGHADSVLEDARAITMAGNRANEDRFVTIGKNRLGQVLVVVYTWRLGRVRI